MLLRHHFQHVCLFAGEYKIYFTPGEFDIIRSHTRHEVMPAHTLLMEQGKKVDKLYFLNQGIARLFRVHNGVDHTLGIVSTNYFLSTPLYVQSGEISSCSLESLSEIDVLVWDLESVLQLKQKVPKMNKMDLAVMDRLLNWLQDNQINSICMTAEERYIHLMETQPLVIQRVPLKYIASLLAIHQDSLSRIRKNLVQKG
ncbi:Crp/Fnr family transcriptional regulator [Sphingobacterium olei]|uniref:Crp/Fnr family transcriptional regulator n=1 Tax=Sphingobacterium olei TaxID=2571155 RepID=A0A4U0P629_9SPHI|nr:cyclic nucleotide-binding domain-containing protein [Sphingobacterium olei]TJZ62896.1 Crp/Fnr family transcriptional regulator [Sphingobacterium olei]